MTIQEINIKLEDIYGRIENRPHYRVVWSDDQFEKRKTQYTPEGMLLLHPEVRQMPKYKQWVQSKYILERLTVVPEIGENDLIEKLSYEPIWVFEDRSGNPLRPVWSAIHFILESLHSNIEHPGEYTKYKDPESHPEEALELKKQRVDNLTNELFGNETDVTTALAHKQGVVVPSNYLKES